MNRSLYVLRYGGLASPFYPPPLRPSKPGYRNRYATERHAPISNVQRRFRILDALALVFAAAIAFAACPQFHPAGIGVFDATRFYDFSNFENTTLVIFTCVLAALVLVDGAKLRRSIRRPGRACLITLVIVIVLAPLTNFNGLQMAFSHDSIWWKFLTIIHSTVLNESDHWAWPTIVATWLVLATQGRRINFSDWLDLAGLIVSALWISYTMTLEFYHYWPF